MLYIIIESINRLQLNCCAISKALLFEASAKLIFSITPYQTAWGQIEHFQWRRIRDQMVSSPYIMDTWLGLDCGHLRQPHIESSISLEPQDFL